VVPKNVHERTFANRGKSRNITFSKTPCSIDLTVGIAKVWSQQYDVSVQCVGHPEKWDEIAIEGDMIARACTVRFKRDGHLQAIASLSRDHDNFARRAFFRKAGGLTAYASRCVFTSAVCWIASQVCSGSASASSKNAELKRHFNSFA
jgi:hypothetical protein